MMKLYKNKFTKEQMITAALDLVRREGTAALTARSLAEALGTSTQPVFTCFTTMDEAKRAGLLNGWHKAVKCALMWSE